MRGPEKPEGQAVGNFIFTGKDFSFGGTSPKGGPRAPYLLLVVYLAISQGLVDEIDWWSCIRINE